MHRIVAPLFLCCAVSLVALRPALAVTINWSPVGNQGNAADGTSFGAVGYAYYIDKYDVTNAQYAEFLNAKDQAGANTLGLWNNNMADATFGGINFAAGNPDGSKYGLISGNQNHPVNFVTWYDTIRFANWMNNGQGGGETETGAYTLLHEGSPKPTPTPSNGLSITRNATATVFLPSEDEWYKAAFYNVATNSYFRFPTGSNATPIASGPTGLANHANYNDAVGNLTDAGAYTATTSPYGAFDMGGNVYQWNEALLFGSFRGLRGGAFDNNSLGLLSSNRSNFNPSSENFFTGFRVASDVPEPSTGALAAIAGGMLWWWRKWFT